MARPPAAYRETHLVADKHEAELRRTFIKAMRKLQADVSVNDLAVMISTGHRQMVGPLLTPKTKIARLLETSGNVVKDAVMSGGKLGAAQVNARTHAK